MAFYDGFISFLNIGGLSKTDELVYRVIVACGDIVIYTDKVTEELIARLSKLSPPQNQAQGFTDTQIRRLQQEVRTMNFFWLMLSARTHYPKPAPQRSVTFLVSTILQQQIQLSQRDIETFNAAFAKGAELNLFHERLQQYFFFSGGIDPFQIDIPLLGAKQYVSTLISEPNFTLPIKQLRKERPLPPEMLRPYRERLDKYIAKRADFKPPQPAAKTPTKK